MAIMFKIPAHLTSGAAGQPFTAVISPRFLSTA